MSKQITIKLFIILIIVAIISVTAFFVDVNMVISNKKPMFSVQKSVYEDGGTIEYVGLFYKIFDYKITNGKNKIEFGTWFSNYNAN